MSISNARYHHEYQAIRELKERGLEQSHKIVWQGNIPRGFQIVPGQHKCAKCKDTGLYWREGVIPMNGGWTACECKEVAA